MASGYSSILLKIRNSKMSPRKNGFYFLLELLVDTLGRAGAGVQ